MRDGLTRIIAIADRRPPRVPGRAIEERSYNRTLSDLSRASELAPDFALLHWKLGLLYEAMGNTAKARERFLRYQQLAITAEERERAQFHLNTSQTYLKF